MVELTRDPGLEVSSHRRHSLCPCQIEQDTFFPLYVLIQPRKTCLDMT